MRKQKLPYTTIAVVITNKAGESRRFDSLNKAAQHLGACVSNVSRAARGMRETVAGHRIEVISKPAK
jgi:hypothetical protein